MIHLLFIFSLLGVPSLQELVDAKRWADAEAQLESVSPEARPRFEGLIAQGRGDAAAAAEAFERAIEATPGVPQLHLHAAHAYFQLKGFKDALRHAQAASSLRDELIAQPLLEARALEGLGRDGEAFEVLSRACQAYTKEYRLWFELAVLAHRKSLFEEVRQAAKEVLARNPERGAVLSLFQLLYRDRNAFPLLEELAARFPEDPEVRAHLGHAYARHRRWFTAARLFEEATALGGEYRFEAADQYRMAGRYGHALRINGQTPASDAQRSQRVAILFEQEQYARIAAMSATFNEPGDRYRVAYSHYAVGDLIVAIDQLRALLGTSYEGEARALLEVIGQSTKTGIPQ